MKKHYEVNYNGEKLSFNHHEEVFEQIQDYYKYNLLYKSAEKRQETCTIGGVEFLVTDLIESWASYPHNKMGEALHERLADTVFIDMFANEIKWLIEYEGEKTAKIDFPEFDFSILKKDGEV